MGKRKRKKISSTLTWKATKGFFRLLFKGLFKGAPLLVLGLIGFGIFWGIRGELYADPGFLIQIVDIIPEGTLSPSIVRELEKTYLKRNLFKISLREISEMVERDPDIREARVIRQFPKTLRIEIDQRTPFAQVQLQRKGTYYIVASDGVILETDSSRNKNFLLIENYDAKNAEPREGRKLSLPGFEEGVNLVRAFQNHPLAKSEKMERLRLDPLGNVSLLLKDGPELRFGRHPMKKFHMLTGVTPLLKGKDRPLIAYIDLQYQDLIVRKYGT
ncbi:MAG: FtsQ-type POTRA domain-containing protein [Candidatus Omnitrophica bacterium]|nr:FtsQ-type POTRA domain-containing protein [Candidatus Omnitrophota bacterium]